MSFSASIEIHIRTFNVAITPRNENKPRRGDCYPQQERAKRRH